jgi:hypothetical protein
MQISRTKQSLSTAYHPQTDGQTERVNRVLEDMLRNYVAASQDDWDDKLPAVEFAINNAEHDTTKMSPSMLNYGYSPWLPVSFTPQARVPAATAFIQQMQRRISEARTAHKVATQRQQQYANKKRQDVSHARGDWVLLSSKNLRFKKGTPKLLPRWVGPFQIVRQVGKQAYELDLPAHWKIHDVFHVSQLQPYKRSGDYQPPPPAEILEGEPEYEVDHIVRHREIHKHKNKPADIEYLVAWRGALPEEYTWEPAIHLKHAAQAVRTYWEKPRTRWQV